MELDEKLEKYLKITEKALKKVKFGKNVKIDVDKSSRDFLDMAERYFKDAKYFIEKGDKLTAFAALNYAHGWLDAGSRLGLFDVKDGNLFVLKK
jgi:hypothetical protein